MTSPDYPTSAQRALEAGLDVILQTLADHAALFWPAFREGRIAAATIDSAVVRVLRLKFSLGLFELPYVNEDSASDPAMMTRHRALAREAALASLVLLQNSSGALPLDPGVRSVAVVGAGATVRYAPGPGRGTAEFVAVPASAFAGGAVGEYFASPAMAEAPVVRRTDATIDFSWPFGGPDRTLAYGWYTVRWNATIIAPIDGTLRLGVDANAGYRLFVDDTLRLDRWETRPMAPAAMTLHATRATPHRVRLEYAQSSGAGRVRLVWDAGAAHDWQGDIARAVAEVWRSDAAVVVAGIEEGEFRDRASLRLPGHQDALIEAVAATGKPVVGILVAGSAVTMNGWGSRVGAVLQAWYPGDAGGDAVAAVLFGDSPPAGHLPFTVPLSEGQLPLTYYHKPTGRGDDYVDLTGRPLFPFGHGMSTTRFAWRSMSVAPASIVAGDSVTVRVTLRNDGARPGKALVQLYLRDEIASVARPVLSLVGVASASLAVGEERAVEVPVPAAAFTLLDAQLRRTAEPGRFILFAGASSDDLRLREAIELRPLNR
jgi:beta-glucosidase